MIDFLGWPWKLAILALILVGTVLFIIWEDEDTL